MGSLAALAVVAVVLAGCGGGNDGVTVTEAWARPTPAGADVAAVYFEVGSHDDDVLVGVAVPAAVATGAAMHETTTVDGQTTMGPVGEVPLAAGDDVVFGPRGLHVMLTDLTRPLQDGDRFDVTLRFGTSDPVTVTVDVGDP